MLNLDQDSSLRVNRKPSVKRRDLQKNIVLTGNRTINF